VARWSEYPTTSDITLSNSTGIVPADTSDPIRLKTNYLIVQDVNGGWGSLNIGESINMQTSSSSETYGMGFSPFVTGSISSFVVVRGDDLGITTAPLYISSLYLGNFGGTVSGELTTDETATNLYWKGTQLNGGGGGGGDVTTANLTSTVVGLGTVGYISSGGGGGGDVTTANLVSTIERWATYPAVSSIVFANDVDFTRNEIVSPGATFFNLVNEIGVLATTSSTTDGIYPSRTFLGAGLTIVDQFDPINPGNTSYSYSIVAGQSYTGTVSSVAIVDSSSAPAALYVSSLYFGNQGGTVTGNLTTDVTATELYYSTNQLANVKVNVVVSSLGADNPQLFSEDIGKYFLFTQSNMGTTVNFPTADSNLNGWNVVIKNMEGSSASITLNTGDSNALAPGVVATVVCDGISFYSL
jgi:hypothetical protein